MFIYAIRCLHKPFFEIYKKKESILQLRPFSSNLPNCFNNKGIKHFSRLCFGLSHHRDHKIEHGFLASYYLIHCLHFANKRSILLNIVSRHESGSEFLLVSFFFG